jgi:hypothetical protein
MSWLGAHLPAHLVPLTDLVHAIREGAEGREEDGSGAGARGGDPARVAPGGGPSCSTGISLMLAIPGLFRTRDSVILAPYPDAGPPRGSNERCCR